jgi:hypothetical protein
LLVFYKWVVNTSQAYRPESLFDQRTKKGFCSRPWQELAVLADGRVSFCCVDLTGGTAFTAKEEIWEHSLLELWRDERIINIRKNFRKNIVQLEVCKRCLSDIPNNRFYADDHRFDTVFSPKSEDLFPVDSLGCQRLYKMGPTKTKAGQDFNVQPNGESAIWAKAENVTQTTVIVWGETRLKGHAKVPNLVTGAVPKELYSKPGQFQIFLLDTNTGAKSTGLVFTVEP